MIGQESISDKREMIISSVRFGNSDMLIGECFLTSMVWD